MEHALTKDTCAYAHDVKEAIPGIKGNIDHVAATPAGVWVVETKSDWIHKDKYPKALAQAAGAVRPVKRHLRTRLPIRAALVLNETDQTIDRINDRDGQPVHVLDVKTFWRRVRDDAKSLPAQGMEDEVRRVVASVWDMGSTRHRGD